ncbi:MAG: hypothetical protein AAGN15_10430 [Cyanobacteria bacterium J06581_3]
MSHSSRKHPNARRLLMRMSKEQARTFTPAQLNAIEGALVPHTHHIDIRSLIPLLGKGAYFVLIAGPNRRNAPRTPQNRNPQTLSGTLSDVISVSQACQNSPNAYRLLSRLDKAIAATFSPAQIYAVEVALEPRRHVIDLRLSLPFLGKGAYLAFAAGPNRRARYRNLQNRNPFVLPAVVLSSAVGAASLFFLVQLKSSELVAQPDPEFSNQEAFHPTSLPFKKNRGECEESNRQWVNNQCIDETHDPVF